MSVYNTQVQDATTAHQVPDELEEKVATTAPQDPGECSDGGSFFEPLSNAITPQALSEIRLASRQLPVMEEPSVWSCVLYLHEKMNELVRDGTSQSQIFDIIFHGNPKEYVLAYFCTILVKNGVEIYPINDIAGITQGIKVCHSWRIYETQKKRSPTDFINVQGSMIRFNRITKLFEFCSMPPSMSQIHQTPNSETLVSLFGERCYSVIKNCIQNPEDQAFVDCYAKIDGLSFQHHVKSGTINTQRMLECDGLIQMFDQHLPPGNIRQNFIRELLKEVLSKRQECENIDDIESRLVILWEATAGHAGDRTLGLGEGFSPCCFGLLTPSVDWKDRPVHRMLATSREISDALKAIMPKWENYVGNIFPSASIIHKTLPLNKGSKAFSQALEVVWKELGNIGLNPEFLHNQYVIQTQKAPLQNIIPEDQHILKGFVVRIGVVRNPDTDLCQPDLSPYEEYGSQTLIMPGFTFMEPALTSGTIAQVADAKRITARCMTKIANHFLEIEEAKEDQVTGYHSKTIDNIANSFIKCFEENKSWAKIYNGCPLDQNKEINEFCNVMRNKLGYVIDFPVFGYLWKTLIDPVVQQFKTKLCGCSQEVGYPIIRQLENLVERQEGRVSYPPTKSKPNRQNEQTKKKNKYKKTTFSMPCRDPVFFHEELHDWGSQQKYLINPFTDTQFGLVKGLVNKFDKMLKNKNESWLMRFDIMKHLNLEKPVVTNKLKEYYKISGPKIVDTLIEDVLSGRWQPIQKLVQMCGGNKAALRGAFPHLEELYKLSVEMKDWEQKSSSLSPDFKFAQALESVFSCIKKRGTKKGGVVMMFNGGPTIFQPAKLPYTGNRSSPWIGDSIGLTKFAQNINIRCKEIERTGRMVVLVLNTERCGDERSLYMVNDLLTRNHIYIDAAMCGSPENSLLENKRRARDLGVAISKSFGFSFNRNWIVEYTSNCHINPHPSIIDGEPSRLNLYPWISDRNVKSSDTGLSLVGGKMREKDRMPSNQPSRMLLPLDGITLGNPGECKDDAICRIEGPISTSDVLHLITLRNTANTCLNDACDMSLEHRIIAILAYINCVERLNYEMYVVARECHQDEKCKKTPIETSRKKPYQDGSLILTMQNHGVSKRCVINPKPTRSTIQDVKTLMATKGVLSLTLKFLGSVEACGYCLHIVDPESIPKIYEQFVSPDELLYVTIEAPNGTSSRRLNQVASCWGGTLNGKKPHGLEVRPYLMKLSKSVFLRKI